MPKKDIHPEWYPDAKIIHNGEVVMTVGATKPEIHVDVWSGTHPFYTGQQRILDTEGQVDRFYKRLQARQDHLKAQEDRDAAQVAPDRPLSEIKVGKRALEALAGAGITNAGEFLAALETKGETELLEIDAFGRKSLADIKKGLRALGYTMPEDAVS